MPREGTGPDFIEALARGLEVITAFQPRQPVMSLTDMATATGLARPTARRILLTLVELGYVRPQGGGFDLTPRVLDLGVAYVRSMGLWDVARPHLEWLVERRRPLRRRLRRRLWWRRRWRRFRRRLWWFRRRPERRRRWRRRVVTQLEVLTLARQGKK